jgi:hypothetical protein
MQTCDGTGQWGGGVPCGNLRNCTTTACGCAGGRVGIEQDQIGYNCCYGQYGANLCPGYMFEGVPFYVFPSLSLGGLEPLYRCHTAAGLFFLSVYGNCEGAGILDGPIGYVATGPDCGSQPLYRLTDATGDSIETIDPNYVNQLEAAGWTDLVIVGYAWPN